MKCQKCSSVWDLVGVSLFFFFFNPTCPYYSHTTQISQSNRSRLRCCSRRKKKFVSTTRKTSLSCYHMLHLREQPLLLLYFYHVYCGKVPVLTEAYECHCNMSVIADESNQKKRNCNKTARHSITNHHSFQVTRNPWPWAIWLASVLALLWVQVRWPEEVHFGLNSMIVKW